MIGAHGLAFQFSFPPFLQFNRLTGTFQTWDKTTKQWEWWDFVSILSWASKNQKALNVLHFCASIYQKFCEVYLSSKNFCRSFSLKLLFFCKSLSWCCIYWMLLSPKFTFAKVLHCRSIKFELSPVVLLHLKWGFWSKMKSNEGKFFNFIWSLSKNII